MFQPLRLLPATLRIFSGSAPFVKSVASWSVLIRLTRPQAFQFWLTCQSTRVEKL